MGAFYNSFHVRRKTQQEVIDQIVALQKEGQEDQQVNCIVGIAQNGWVPVYAELYFDTVPLAGTISEQLQTNVLLIDVHDDDVFSYYYFRNGEMVDTFNSCPDYFGSSDMQIDFEKFDKTAPEKLNEMLQKMKTEFDFSSCKNNDDVKAMAGKFREFFEQTGLKKNNVTNKNHSVETEESESEEMIGHPECFAELLDNSDDVKKLVEIMESMRKMDFTFVSAPAEDFCNLLKLHDALNSYTYLLEEELPEGYIHVQKTSSG
ncbi:MAG: hypothetical protein LBG58_05475 [Planctomycetaceae bacterium]|jgi:hypothetical protein|nr:hypothetical protein [Planctomycetaceae bacterium]